MRWDRFFEDIEDQLASEQEAERVALEAEAERLRVARLALDERLAALMSGTRDAIPVAFELLDGTVLRAPIAGLGADWLLAAPGEATGSAAIVPLAALASIGVEHADLLRSARPGERVGSTGVSRRTTFGYAMRDLARRRAGVAVHTLGGKLLTGTIDRAGADHLDLAMHPPGAPRRASEVTGFRILPFPAITWVGIDAPLQVVA